MLQDWPTVCLWPVFLSHAQMTLHIPSERSGSVSKPSRAHRAHANHLVFEAQVILINVFLVQYLSGQLRCFRVENVGSFQNGFLSGSTVLLTMTVDVPLFGCPEKKRRNDGLRETMSSLTLDFRLLHLAWFWRVESSSRAAPTQPMTQQLNYQRRSYGVSTTPHHAHHSHHSHHSHHITHITHIPHHSHLTHHISFLSHITSHIASHISHPTSHTISHITSHITSPITSHVTISKRISNHLSHHISPHPSHPSHHSHPSHLTRRISHVTSHLGV